MKLALTEAESDALASWIDEERAVPVSSVVAAVEVRRAVARRRSDRREARARAEAVLGELNLVEADADVLAAAASIEPPTTTTLDAIHIASALRLGENLRLFVTYDERQAAAARASGLDVFAAR